MGVRTPDPPCLPKHVPAKNAPDFIIRNMDTPKTRPILGLNRRREIFRGVCNTPLHGYVQNLSGFTFPHTDAPKTHPILPFPIRIHRKPARFYTQTVGEGHFRAYAIRPYTGTCKIWRVLNSATRHDAKPGGFWTLPHDIARNPAGFGLCHTTWRKTRRVLGFATSLSETRRVLPRSLAKRMRNLSGIGR